MRAEILCVGTEILLGDIVNTNAQYIANRLAELGIDVYYHSVVGDNPARLKDAYELAFSRVDLVITTGGLGPTKDDLTKEIAAEYFNREMQLDEYSLDLIKNYYNKTNRHMPKSNEKQAYFPSGSKIVKNDNGTAPGFILESEGKILIQLPGPPREMKPMMIETVIPYLREFNDYVIESKVLRIIGVGESSAEEIISDLIENQTNPTIAPYAKFGETTFRITAKAKSKEEAIKMIEPVELELRKRFEENIYGINEDTLEGVVTKLLIEKKMTIATAESCTGGMLAARLINYPGISEVFLEGAVTYSNESKMNRLGVSKETLDNYGAVSHETAAEMAKGIANTASTNIGVSTTGIAGPGIGDEEKPVGLVYIGLCINGEVKTKEVNIKGDRQAIRERATMIAVDFLRREIIK